MLARQAFYHLSHLWPFFALVIFQIGSQVFAWGWSWTTILLPTASPIVGITGTGCHVRLTDWDGLIKSLSGLALNLDLPNLCLPINWDYRHETLHLAYECLLNKRSAIQWCVWIYCFITCCSRCFQKGPAILSVCWCCYPPGSPCCSYCRLRRKWWR
jgi:hypothetical protein